MEVDFSFLADAAEATSGKIYVIGGAFDTIWAQTVPVAHPHLSFVMRLVLSPAELGQVHKVELVLVDEDGTRITSVGGNITVGRQANLPPGWRQGFLTVLNFANLRFERFGDYSFELIINNSSMKSINLRVAQRVQITSSA